MSLISDALAKAQRERSEPHGARLYRTPGVPKPGQPAAVRVKSVGFVWGATTAVTLILLGSFLYLRTFRSEAEDAPSRPPPVAEAPDVLPSTLAAATSTPVSDTSSTATPAARAASNSPFTPAPAPLPMTTQSDYELAGMSAAGSTTLLSIARRSDKRSFWIPVGKTVNGITAISYDAATDHAVIEVNGRTLTLGLRDVGSPETQPAE